MANINKSFNFRNGVQVDEDNFIVNPNGLVGIGTSLPTEILDVYGTAKITGLVTATNLAVSGVSTFYNDVKVGSAITAVASTGVVYATQFVGSASGLTGIVAISTNGWIVNAGTLSTASKVGIGTSFPYYSLQVGNDPLTGNGFSVDALSGNVNTTGILTASDLKTIGSITGYNFSGFGTDITGINATNISNGTLNNSRLPSSINLTGIITGYSFSGFGTDITGINATNISNGTLDNSRLPTDLNISGIITANSGVVTSLTAGIASITQLYVSGVTTSLQGFVGNIVGIASTALSLSGSPSITVTNIYSTGIITSSSITSGIITASTRLYAESVGVGTSSPSADIHIHRNSISKLQVTSDTAESIIAVGRSTTLTGSNGALRFGNTSANTPYSTPKSLDIINYDSGNLNFYLQLGSLIQTGTFNWFRGHTAPASPIMTLTYAGYLGIGITLPTHNIHVSGSSTVTENSYVGQNFYVAQNAYIAGSVTANGFNGNATTATTATTATNAQGLTGTPNLNVGIVTATNGFISGVGTAVQISTVGNVLFFTVPGVGTTSLTLF